MIGRGGRPVLFWLPRLLAMAVVVFTAALSLDAFSPSRTALQNVLAFAIHLIPTMVLALIIAISWRWKWASVILMALFGAFIVVTLQQRGMWIASILLGLAGLLAIDALLNRRQAFR